LETNILKNTTILRRERLSAKLSSGPHASATAWRPKFKKKLEQTLRREPRGPALGEEPLFTESQTLTKDYFHQILFKNSKQIQNFVKTEHVTRYVVYCL
jgi:hypothetical protein